MPEPTHSPWVIELVSPKMPKPLKLRLEDRIVIGRGVAGDAKLPDVDLASYDAESLGVSRAHLAIYPDNDRLMVVDLESGNGTFLNGNRLKPGEPYYLAHDDHLQLGRMKLDVKLVVSPNFGSGVHKQPSLQLHDQEQAGKGELVLIVEDDTEVAKVLSIILERAGYTTRISSEVVGAIRAYNQHRPNAVILDLMLPDMNGLEFCRYVRRDVLQNTMPIIVVSAARSAANVVEAMQAGADIFLDKPVSAKELRYVLASLINQHRMGNAGLHTKHLVGTAPLRSIAPESRRDACVMFVAGYSDAPITLMVQQPVSFGRAGGSGSFKTHVDLSRYEAVNQGVSRVHMFLHNRDGRFFIDDNEAVNGTYINGEPVKPHDLIEVKNADEIRLGSLRMYIYFLGDRDGEDI